MFQQVGPAPKLSIVNMDIEVMGSISTQMRDIVLVSTWTISPYMGVSENSGTSKSSLLIRFSIINHPSWGTTIFGNPHISATTICIISGAWATLLKKKHELKLNSISSPRYQWKKYNEWNKTTQLLKFINQGFNTSRWRMKLKFIQHDIAFVSTLYIPLHSINIHKSWSGNKKTLGNMWIFNRKYVESHDSFSRLGMPDNGEPYEPRTKSGLTYH